MAFFGYTGIEDCDGFATFALHVCEDKLVITHYFAQGAPGEGDLTLA